MRHDYSPFQSQNDRRVPRRWTRPRKTLISIRIDGDVLAAYRATGPGWQRHANEALRMHLSNLPKEDVRED